jgi:eukaryotic-like serine/threonine-protein kinase
VTGPVSEVFADDTGRYRLDSRIATGGMGVVWRGTDTVLDRVVAIKILKAEFADDATFRSRFETEARHAASLHHPGVAAVFDSGQGQANDGGGPRPFLVMEFVDGQPLSNLLRPNAPLDPAVARTLIADAADAIGAAHAAGIVHRDVKPANLLVTPDRQIKITDFGIARAADGIALTATGQVMGTPQYLSPEQAEGSTATPASDIYSLGVVLFECLAGYRPFGGDTPITTALAHLRDPIPDLPDFVPADLAAVVRRALAKKPSERFATAADFAAALRNPTGVIAAPMVAPVPPGDADGSTRMLPSVGSTETPAPTPTPTSTSTPAPSADRPPRSPAWLWILLAVLVIAVVAVLLITQLNNSSDDPGPTETSSSGSTPTEDTSAPSSSTTSAATVTIDADDYIGRNVDEVAQELRDLGLRVSTRRVDNPGDEEEDTVENVSPDGELEKRDKVTVTYWGAPPETSPPTSEPTSPDTSQPSTPPTSEPTSPATTTPAGETSSEDTEQPVEGLRGPGRATRDE